MGTGFASAQLTYTPWCAKDLFREPLVSPSSRRWRAPERPSWAAPGAPGRRGAGGRASAAVGAVPLGGARGRGAISNKHDTMSLNQNKDVK